MEQYCERCFELSSILFDKTEYYVSLVEQQNRMLRDGKSDAAILDGSINAAKRTKDKLADSIALHRATHIRSTRLRA